MLHDDDVFDMANLTNDQAGIDGIVFISTVMGGHGPNVKYFLEAGRTQPSFSVSVSDPPRIVATSLPDRVVNQMAPLVIDWVRRNRVALLSFWNEGDSWTKPEADAFIDALQKLP